jgi:hypothetical protein
MFVAVSKLDGLTMGPFEDESAAMAFIADLSGVVDEDELTGHAAIWTFTEILHVEDPRDLEWVKPETSWSGTDFGPGRLESIEVERYRDNSLRIGGVYYVACGNGGNHYVDINEQISGDDWLDYVMQSRRERRPDEAQTEWMLATRYTAIQTIIEESLEHTWTDPCEAAANELESMADEFKVEALVRRGYGDALYITFPEFGDEGEPAPFIRCELDESKPNFNRYAKAVVETMESELTRLQSEREGHNPPPDAAELNYREVSPGVFKDAEGNSL